MTSGVVSVDELARAYRAAVSGQFRNGVGPSRAPCGRGSVNAHWTPGSSEQVLLVVGSFGSAGASTVALALATCAGEARVVECCSVASSGLAAATSAELGVTSDGWVQGSRDAVLIERRGDRVPALEFLPIPSSTKRPLTILDCSWDVDVLVASDSWLGELARSLPAVAVVTRPTVPGIRRLEAAISLLGEARVHAVLVGVEKRWPKHVEQGMGPVVRRLRDEGRFTSLLADPMLSLCGITPEPLPAPTLSGSADLLAQLKGLL